MVHLRGLSGSKSLLLALFMLAFGVGLKVPLKSILLKTTKSCTSGRSTVDVVGVLSAVGIGPSDPDNFWSERAKKAGFGEYVNGVFLPV
jgi:hypothetical protein